MMQPASEYQATTIYKSVTYKIDKFALMRNLGIEVPDGAEVRISSDLHSFTVTVNTSVTEIER